MGVVPESQLEQILTGYQPVYPTDGATCMVTITTDDTHIEAKDCGYGLGDLKLQLGEGDSEACDVIDASIRKMKEGETCTVTLPQPGQGQEEGHRAAITLHIQLNSFHCRPSIYALDAQCKYDLALHHKSMGVELFKRGNIEFAFRRFSLALKYIILMLPLEERTSPTTESQESSLDEVNQQSSSLDEVNGQSSSLEEVSKKLRCQCYSNMAACQMKTGSYDYVISNCDKALRLEPCNVKSLFRRAEAFLHTGKLEQSRKDVIAGLKIEPQSRSFQTLLRTVDTKLSTSNK